MATEQKLWLLQSSLLLEKLEKRCATWTDVPLSSTSHWKLIIFQFVSWIMSILKPLVGNFSEDTWKKETAQNLWPLMTGWGFIRRNVIGYRVVTWPREVWLLRYTDYSCCEFVAPNIPYCYLDGRHPFLQMLDCVSRGHDMVNYPSSVAIILEAIYSVDFFQISVVACPAPYAQMFFEFLKKNVLNVFYNFSWFFSIFVTMGPYGGKVLKPYSSLKALLSFTKLLNFLLIGPHKSTVLDFLNF